MARRTYTPDDRSSALAALVANGGNLKRTAAQLDIPPRTLRAWRDAPEPGGDDPPRKKASLAEALEAIAWKLLDAIEGKIAGARLGQVATAMGIAIDKARLLRGESTAINEQRGTLLDAIDTLTADAIARAAAREEASPVPADGPVQPLDTPGRP